MKYLKLFLLVFLISFMTPADLNSQERPRKVVGQVNTAAFVLSYDFTVPGDTSKIEFTVAVPRTLPERQRIFIKYQPKPTKLFYENGNRYAKFIFVKPKKQFKVEMNMYLCCWQIQEYK